MKIRMMKESGFGAASVAENIRGEQVMQAAEFAGLVAAKKAFSVFIANGRGELFLKYENGQWMQSVVSVDKVFGIIRSKYSPVANQ